jgi:HSP20 family protein
MEEKMRSRMGMVPLGRGPALWGGLRDEGHPLDIFHRGFDRLFEDMWRGFDLPMAGEYEPLRAKTPMMDMAEDDDEIRLSVELPGMDEEDIEVVLSEDVLTIKGEKKAETEKGDKTYSYKERAYGSFRRSLPLGANIRTDKIEAHFDKGVLTITLPKTEEAKTKTRKIPVSASSKVKRLHKKAA